MPAAAYQPHDRSLRQEPITPADKGAPPTWVVRCQAAGCGWAVDAHGSSGADAIELAWRFHDPSHRAYLTAETIDYTTGYPERLGGEGPRTFPHPLYR